MRTLAFLLIFLNLSFLFWQLEWLTWFPWQPAQLHPKTEPRSPKIISNLPQLVLLKEHDNTSKNIAKTVTDFADIPKKEEIPSAELVMQDIITENITTKSNLNNQKPAAPIVISSTLQKVAGIDRTTMDPSVAAKSSTDETTLASSALTQQISQRLSEPKPKDSTFEEPSVCFEVGPYLKRKTVQKMANWLKGKKKLEFRIQTRQIKKNVQSTWVYLPPFSNQQDALKTLQRFNEQGIRKDYGIVRGGAFKNAISLGLYRKEIYVKQRIDELKAKGYNNVQIRKRYRNDTKYWLNVKMLRFEQNELKETFRQNFSTVLVSVACKSFDNLETSSDDF